MKRFFLNLLAWTLAIGGISGWQGLAAKDQPATEQPRLSKDDVQRLIEERRRALRESAGQAKEAEPAQPGNDPEGQQRKREVQWEMETFLRQLPKSSGARCVLTAIEVPVADAESRVLVVPRMRCEADDGAKIERSIADTPGLSLGVRSSEAAHGMTYLSFKLYGDPNVFSFRGPLPKRSDGLPEDWLVHDMSTFGFRVGRPNDFLVGPILGEVDVSYFSVEPPVDCRIVKQANPELASSSQATLNQNVRSLQKNGSDLAQLLKLPAASKVVHRSLGRLDDVLALMVVSESPHQGPKGRFRKQVIAYSLTPGQIWTLNCGAAGPTLADAQQLYEESDLTFRQLLQSFEFAGP